MYRCFIYIHTYICVCIYVSYTYTRVCVCVYVYVLPHICGLSIVSVTWGGTFITNAEPVLTHHNHLKSIVYLSLCILWVWTNNYILSIFTALEILCVLFIHPFPLPIRILAWKIPNVYYLHVTYVFYQS